MADLEEPEASDEALASAASAGEAAALDRLIRRHEARVLRLLRLLGVAIGDREDLAQEVFIRVFRHLTGYRPGSPFAGWLYRIAVNVAHDHRRRMERRSRDEVGWSPAADQSRDQGPGPGETVEREANRRRLESALDSLSERERAVFVLREVEELDTLEVAKTLGITTITVRRHLGRARAHLQRVLEDEKAEKIVRERWTSGACRR